MTQAVVRAATGSPSARRRTISTAHARVAVYVLTALLAVAWTIGAGKDLNWDALNYHLYSGFSAVHDRFAIDFFAAGPPSYINPYAHVPLYLMASAGWRDVAMAVAFALVHVANLWVVHEIALEVAPGRDADRRRVAIVAVVFAALSPVFLQELGSTFADVTTSLPVLVGWWLLLRPALSVRSVAMSGAMLGAATALKLTNAPFAVAAVAMLAVRLLRQPLHSWTTRGGALLAGGTVAFLLVAGPWAWRLQQEFGNPLFPLFNHVFRSPEFITDALAAHRFIPESLAQALLRPFAMVRPDRIVYVETRSPDIRFAVALFALAAWAATAAWRASGNEARGALEDRGSGRRWMVLAAGMAVAWALWLVTSGNGRYALPLGLSVGPLLAVAIWGATGRRTSAFGYATLAVLLVQSLQLAMGTDWRWASYRWEGPWFHVEVPERLAKEPALYLSVDVQSASFVLPYLPAGSGMVAVTGFYAIGPDRPGGERTMRLIERAKERVRMLVPVRTVRHDGIPVPPPTYHLDAMVARFDLRVDESDCEYISFLGGVTVTRVPGRAEVPAHLPKARVRDDRNLLLTCRLVPDPGAGARQRDAKRQADVVFDRVEDVCPNLFHPRRPLTEQRGSWGRTYMMGSDMTLWIYDGEVKYRSEILRGDPISLGPVDRWLEAPQRVDCSRRYAPAFGLVGR